MAVKDAKKYHIGLGPGDVGNYVLVPGDPFRTPLVARFLDGAREVAFSREYRTFTGSVDGVTVSTMSTGMGGPSVAIGIEELHELGMLRGVRDLAMEDLLECQRIAWYALFAIPGVYIVARCRANASPENVATSFTRINGVREATGEGTDTADITFVDGVRLELRCVSARHFAIALWRATGSEEHVELLRARFAERGLSLVGDEIHDALGRALSMPDEHALYRAADLDYVEPEMREAEGEIDAAARHELPRLLETNDIRGILHCRPRLELHRNFRPFRGRVLRVGPLA